MGGKFTISESHQQKVLLTYFNRYGSERPDRREQAKAARRHANRAFDVAYDGGIESGLCAMTCTSGFGIDFSLCPMTNAFDVACDRVSNPASAP